MRHCGTNATPRWQWHEETKRDRFLPGPVAGVPRGGRADMDGDGGLDVAAQTSTHRRQCPRSVKVNVNLRVTVEVVLYQCDGPRPLGTSVRSGSGNPTRNLC